ncbi:hypothetical protein CCUS01_05974, partial [Colletotrichum cuscutae]
LDHQRCYAPSISGESIRNPTNTYIQAHLIQTSTTHASATRLVPTFMQVTGHPISGPLATPPPGSPIGRRRPALRGPTFRDPSQDQVPGPNGPLLARIPVFPFLCGISPSTATRCFQFPVARQNAASATETNQPDPEC